MKNNKNVRKDNLSPVDNSTKRVYKMYKSKKNWVVAPVVLLTLLGAVAPAPIALSNVVNAAETTVTKDVLDARADATTKIKGLEGLTAERKTAFLEAVAKASTVQAALDQVKAAYTEVVKKVNNDFAAEVKKVTDELNNNASTTYKAIDVDPYVERANSAKTKVNDAFNAFKSTDESNHLVVTAGDSENFVAAEDNYATVARPAFDKVLEAQKAELAKVLPDAKQAVKVNTDYAAKKADVLSQINKLTYLSATEKNKFAAQVAVIDADYTKDPSTNWKDRLESTLSDAITADNANKEAQVKAAYDKVMALFKGVVVVTDLTKPSADQLKADKAISVEHKNALVTKIDSANASKDVAKLNSLVNDVNAAIAADSLEVFKSGYRNVINVDTELTAAERDSYITKITNSTNAKDVVTAYNEYLDFKEVKSLKGLDLKTAKSTVTSKLEALKNDQTTGNLTALEVGNYQFAVKTAESVDEVISLFQQAQKANRQRLVDAKDQATNTIKGLKYLSEDQKSTFLLNVENASKATEVEDALTAAKNADKDAEISIAAEKAVDTVKSLKYLSATDQYVDAIRAVDHTSKDPYGDIQHQVDLAVKANYAAGVNDPHKSLDEIKSIAKEAINALPALSESEKATAVKDVDAAKDRSAVQTAFDSANKLNDKNEEARRVAKELADAKAQLVKEINADKYLTSAQKADLVANANAATHTAALNKVRQAFTEASAAAKEAHDKLEAAKTNAINAIREKEYLTATQQADYVRDILNAQSIPAVHNILKDASLTNLNQIDDLDKFEAAAKDEIQLASDTYLNENQTKGLKEAVAAAKTLADKKAAFKAAIEQADAQNDKLVMKELDALIMLDSMKQLNLV